MRKELSKHAPAGRAGAALPEGDPRPVPQATVLWNPAEALAFYALIVAAFGFIMGEGDYGFARELFAPVLIVGIAGAAVQLLLPGALAGLRAVARAATIR